MLNSMLALDDPRWDTLFSCYGEWPVAALLQRLLTESFPLPHVEHRPTLWDRLFSKLYHQGTLYPATIAAMPHLVRIVARVEPSQRTELLSLIAEIEAMRTVGNVYDPQEHITSDLVNAYEEALHEATVLAHETIAAGGWRESVHSESSLAALLSLSAFACGERRLGYLLSRWWPYAETHTAQGLLPVAGLEKYEELTGDVRDRV